MKKHLTLLSLSLLSSLYCVSGYGATVITALPYTITQPGAYVLTKNLTVAGPIVAITINASNVSVDLKGFLITGPGSNIGGHGIEVPSSSSNVTIQNGAIFNFYESIVLNGPDATIQNLRLEGTAVGVIAQNITSCLIQNCSIVSTGSNVGIALSSCSDIAVRNNRIVNGIDGIYSDGNNWFISNYIGSCTTGLNLSPNDKYQGNVTTLCTTPFSGGIAVGTGNN